MATAQARLTPTSDTTAAIVSIPSRELSGRQWVSRFRGSRDIDDCNSPFKENLDAFVAALKAAGATVSIAATYRPPERAYLMHWAWRIWKGKAEADKVPTMDGVLIEWAHKDEDGKYVKSKSVDAAKAMVVGFDIDGLGVAPALASEHTKGHAVDMSITWAGDLKIKNHEDNEVTITTAPKSGMNADLHAVGASYGVIKYNGRGVDKPHWSVSGR